jgi:hypothetical protein
MRFFCKRLYQPKLFFVLVILTIFLANSAQAFKWKTEIVDSSGNTGWYSSLALNGTGMPSIAYTNADTHYLKYAIWNGTVWGFQDIDTSSNASQPSLFFYQGLLGYPEVTYFDGTSPGSLKYTYKRTIPLPMIWVTPETVDTGGVGWGSSLAVDQNGIPKVSYCDFTNNKLKYAIRNGSWGPPVTIDDACSFNLGIGETSLALDGSSNPHIVYWSLGKLKYAYNLGLPSVGWVSEIIDSFSADVGRDNAITLDKDGWFHVSYIDFTNKKLKYAHHNTVNWVIAVPIDDAQDAKTSIAVDDHGGVHICYRKDGDLRYAYNSSKGFSTWVTQTLDGGDPLVGEFCSLKLDPNGKPRISYFDRTNGDLKFTQALYEIYQPLILKGN